MNKLNMKLRTIRVQKEAINKIMKNTNNLEEKSKLKKQLRLLRKEELECLKQLGVEL